MTTYDQWKTTNPADAYLGPEPDEPRPEYRIILANSAGTLDAFTATDLTTAADELAHLLASGSWVLAEGDSIRVTVKGIGD